MNNMDQQILAELKEIKHLLISRRKIAIALTVIMTLMLICLLVIKPEHLHHLGLGQKETIEQK